MARMGNRVTQVANAEAENSEDPEFKHAVSMAATGVSESELLLSRYSLMNNSNYQWELDSEIRNSNSSFKF